MSKKFNDIEELSTWLSENDYSISDFQFNVSERGDCTITTSTPSNTLQTIKLDERDPDEVINVPSVFEVTDIDVKIKSLSEESIDIKIMPINEDINEIQNIWFVDDYECIEDVCSTSEIIFNGDTLLMNVCESNGVATVKLVVEVNKEIKRLPFVLKRACQEDSAHDMIISL
jgi:hypothetical protein